MENKIPTAEEFLKVYLGVDDNFISSMKEQMSKLKGFNFDNIPDFMTEFAKLHVEAALKEASEKVNLKVVNTEEFRDIEEGEDLVDSYECGSDIIHISVNSILNAYPLTNIK